MMRKILAALFLSSHVAMAQNQISDFQWKNRLLIVSGATENLIKQITSENDGLRDRNLKVFILSGAENNPFPAKLELTKEFSKRLSPDLKNPKVYLIGKDGRTTLEWKLSEFTFKKLYASIDAMPMRQREMREGKP
ncbi:MAG: DUF4174 domain-containing protein [Akkermansiaceae bacterium]